MSYVAKTYLKRGCPHSFKFLLFATEAGLLEHFEVVEIVPDDENSESLRAMLAEKMGKAPTFPTVEIEPGNFMGESDDLINLYAEKHQVDLDALSVLPFYKRGVMQNLRNLFMQNRSYKEKFGELDAQ